MCQVVPALEVVLEEQSNSLRIYQYFNIHFSFFFSVYRLQ